jgi:hypothetical protein
VVGARNGGKEARSQGVGAGCAGLVVWQTILLLCIFTVLSEAAVLSCGKPSLLQTIDKFVAMAWQVFSH